MRCFIALELPEEVKDYLGSLQDELKQLSGLNVKFVEPRNLHLTLKFLGEISDARVKQIKERLESVKFRPFKAHLGGIGIFPSESYVRVIWISLEPANLVKELVKAINESIGSSDKRFESHITLARVRNVLDKSMLQKKLKSFKIEKVDFEINSFILMKSTLSREGPVYETLKEHVF